MRELHLFAGSGGGILGGILLGHTTVCAVEIEQFCRENLLQRQRDGILPRFPIWDDVCTFDGKPWRDRVDVICGGFPCQDISSANQNAVGISGERSGLWSEMRRIIGEVRPGRVLVENSPMLVGRGLTRVLSDFAEMGYHAIWGCFYAADVGAPHPRERIFILACDANDPREPTLSVNAKVAKLRKVDAIPVPLGEWWKYADSDKERREGEFSEAILGERGISRKPERVLEGWNGGWPISEPVVVRVDDGVADRVDRTCAVGNGQVPSVVALAWRVLSA